MKFAALVINSSLERDSGLTAFQQRMARLEQLGFSGLAMPDSQSLWPELYVQLTVAALATERATLWQASTEAFPTYIEYQEKAPRLIPVFIAEPA